MPGEGTPPPGHRHGEGHHHGHAHEDHHAHVGDHDHSHEDHAHEGDHSHDDHDHSHHDHHGDHGHHGDHNLRAAYLHVLADALTSLFAIGALLAGKYWGALWMDPAMGILGSVLVARWSWGLLRDTSAVLLDHQGPEAIQAKLREAIEGDGDGKVADLHVWALGDRHFAGIVAVVAHEPRPAEEYKARVPADLGIAHLTVEVHRCD